MCSVESYCPDPLNAPRAVPLPTASPAASRVGAREERHTPPDTPIRPDTLPADTSSPRVGLTALGACSPHSTRVFTIDGATRGHEQAEVPTTRSPAPADALAENRRVRVGGSAGSTTVDHGAARGRCAAPCESRRDTGPVDAPRMQARCDSQRRATASRRRLGRRSQTRGRPRAGDGADLGLVLLLLAWALMCIRIATTVCHP